MKFLHGPLRRAAASPESTQRNTSSRNQLRRATTKCDARQLGLMTFSARSNFVSGWLLVRLKRPPQERFDACLEVIELEWFGHEIGSTEFQAQYAVNLALARTADDNWRASQ